MGEGEHQPTMGEGQAVAARPVEHGIVEHHRATGSKRGGPDERRAAGIALADLVVGAGLGHLLDEAVEPDVLLLIGERCRLDLTSKRRGDAGMVEIAVALFGFPDDEADALPTEGGKRRAAPSNGANGPAIDDELGAVDRGGAVGGEIGDEVGHLFGFGTPPDRDSAQGI